MRPGPHLIRLLAALSFCALLVPLAPLLVWPLLVLVTGALGLLVWEYRLLRGIQVRSERTVVKALPLDEEGVVEIGVRSDANRSVQFQIRQFWPTLLERRSSSASSICAPGEVVKVRFHVRGISRGSEWAPAPHFAITLWGFAERLLQAGEPIEINVLPNLNAVHRLHGKLNHLALQGLGARVAPRLGKGREFDRLRDYVRDDDFRDIAWKATARHQKLIVREFRLDRSQDILLCVDRGHKMAARVGRISKVDHAVNASVLIAYLCNRMEDRVGILSFGAEVERGIPQGHGAAHLRQTTAFSTGIRAEFIHTDYPALAVHLKRRLRQRSLILILTDLPQGSYVDAMLHAIKMLTPQHLPLIMVLSDPDLNAAARFEPSNKEELCCSLVARDALLERRHMMKELRRRGALVVDTSPNDCGFDGMNAYIEVKRKQLL